MSEAHDGCGYDDARVATEGSVEATLRARFMLEVELVEDPLADLPQDCRRVDRGERGGERGEEALEHGEVLANGRRQAGPKHLDSDGLAVEDTLGGSGHPA